MPALDALGGMDAAASAAFTFVLPHARRVASRMPYVRVIVSAHRDDGSEREDVFVKGKLLRKHKSPNARRKEKRVAAGNALYFHAGRAHPAYGQAVMVLRDLGQPIEVTPFGIGALTCNRKSNAHKKGQCVSPIAHYAPKKQAAFVKQSDWGSDWRKPFGDFLAYYYTNDLRRYFGPSRSSRPEKADPDNIFHNRKNRDWRSWTVELRVLGDVDLFGQLRAGAMMVWSIHPSLERSMKANAIKRRVRFSHAYPLWPLLQENRRIKVASSIDDMCFEVDSAVKREVFR